MSKSKRVELQVTVQSQDQWEELLQKEGLIVVDAYAAWCGPCKAIVSTLKRIKNEIGDSSLHFATAETDNIDSLALYRGKSRPTFLFYANGTLVHVIRGCNCPVIIKTIKNQLEREHKVLEGKLDRIEFIDKEVGIVQSEDKKDEQKDISAEDDELAAKMTESMMRMRNRISFRDFDYFVETEVPKEVSLAIIKPDAVKAGLVDEIIAKVEEEGMEILRKEERTLTKEEAAEFYKQHEGSEHFEDLVEFMSSGPCMTLIISKGETGDGVIPQIRDLIGPKDVNLAKEQAPTSIRALYGTSSVMNAIHACDTSESAARELAFFFPDFVSPAVKTKKLVRPKSQKTLALVRPDALRHHKDSIIAKIKEAGFTIAMAKELTLSREEAEDFYSEHKGKDFFEPLVNNMCSGPVMALCLAKEDAVEGWRNLLGPKEVHVAAEEAPDSLRAQFHVEDSGFNPLHGSDSVTAAHKEIQKIFPVQTTVAVIKPETADENADAIINKIQESGFRIISRKDVGLTKELATQFYSEHTGKDFFEGLTDYMSSGQSTVLLLEREDAVTGWRAMMGPTDPLEAREKAPDSIRAIYGKDIVRNAVHGSSNMEKAGKVIEELFPDVELLPNGRAVDEADEKSGGNEGQVTTEDGQATAGDKPVTEKDVQGDETNANNDGGTEEQDSSGKDGASGSQTMDGDTAEGAVGTVSEDGGKDGESSIDSSSAGVTSDDTSKAHDTANDTTAVSTANDTTAVSTTNDTTGDGTNDSTSSPLAGNGDTEQTSATSEAVTGSELKDVSKDKDAPKDSDDTPNSGDAKATDSGTNAGDAQATDSSTNAGDAKATDSGTNAGDVKATDSGTNAGDVKATDSGTNAGDVTDDKKDNSKDTSQTGDGDTTGETKSTSEVKEGSA